MEAESVRLPLCEGAAASAFHTRQFPRVSAAGPDQIPTRKHDDDGHDIDESNDDVDEPGLVIADEKVASWDEGRYGDH